MVALVTGASSGIGRDIARELAKRNYNLIIVARRKENLDKLKVELEEKYAISVEVVVQDIRDREGCIKMHSNIKEKYGTVDILINNAGLGDCGRFYKTSLEKDLDIIDTNIAGMHIILKLFLQDMVEENKGHILNVGSIAGFMPGPLMSTYYASKSYVVRLSQSVQKELTMNGSKVKVSVVCPGPVKTEFEKVADVKFNMFEESSEHVAKSAVRQMLAGKKVIFTAPHIWLVRILAKIIPDSIMSFFCYFVQKRKTYDK